MTASKSPMDTREGRSAAEVRASQDTRKGQGNYVLELTDVANNLSGLASDLQIAAWDSVQPYNVIEPLQRAASRIREVRSALAEQPPEGEWRPFAVTDALVGYVERYGGRCRDCGDEDGVCPSSGLPCGGSGKAIRHVLDALNYGVKHGFVRLSPLVSSEGEGNE